MDRAQIDSEHLVARYLSGRLDPSEEAAFDVYCQHHPEIYSEIEASLWLREGLCALHHRGELTQLVSRPTRHYRPWALAAAVAGCAFLVVWIGRLVWSDRHDLIPSTPLLASSPTALSSRANVRLPVTAPYSLMRSRDTAPESAIALPASPAAVEVRVLPSQFDPAARYRITLQSEVTGGAASSVADLAAGPDRYVVVYIDSAQLRPGDYRLVLAPSAGNAAPGHAETFFLRVK